MYIPTNTLMSITTAVSRMTSLLVGHVTFFSSSYVSRKNVTGVVIIQNTKTPAFEAASIPYYFTRS